MSESHPVIVIDGQEHELLLTTGAAKKIIEKFGDLKNPAAELVSQDRYAEGIDAYLWIVCLLANEATDLHNLRNKDDKREPLTEREVELLTTPIELIGFNVAINDAMVKGVGRNIHSERADDGKNSTAG